MEQIAHKSRLSEIYADASKQIPRYKNLLTKFAELYGGSRSPELILRSPGRVNIIGDHIDYSYFSVLPMAVESDMVMVVDFDEVDPNSCATGDYTVPSTIEISNMDSNTFPSHKFEFANGGPLLPIDASKSDWVNYFRCGLRVAQEFLRAEDRDKTHLIGMKILIDGNVPTGSGLSSSAAFVVCSTLAVLIANGYRHISKALLTTLSIKCEQHVGVNSGGMDQSASIFGLKNHALYVSFVPSLSVKPFAFPVTHPKMAFVIANSLITANKHETGPVNYNLRVVEVTLAANIMAKKLRLTLENDGNLQAGTLRGVLEKYYAKASDIEYGTNEADSRKKLTKMAQLVDEILVHKDGYTTEQVAEELGMSVDEVKKKYMTTYPVRYETLQLYRRAIHVYEESKRVLDFLAALEHSAYKSDREMFRELGKLMNESHQSAIHNFQNSCPELDDICTIALANGSFGSRVTGAGFGGSTVHLVPADKAETLIKALTDQYYKKRFPNITNQEIAEAIVLSEPGTGTTIVDNISLD
jgi:galactokinase